MNKEIKTQLILGSFLIFLGIGLGAFGAHGLKNILTEKLLATFHTGIRFQMYHGFGLIFLSLVSKTFDLDLKVVARLFLTGIILFSVNCYVYALTEIKTFALIVPLGGLSFLAGWLILSLKAYKLKA